MTISIRIGNWLFKHAFPIYNRIYPLFKKKQDQYELKLIDAWVKESDIVIDIGANIGFYTAYLAQKVGKTGKVYAFEPDSENFRRLKQNTRHLPQVIAVQAAVSNENGVLKVYKSKMLNVDHRTYPVENADTVEEIKCIALDSFIPENEKPGFIKIDIQGFEFFAFQGMSKLIQRSESLHVISEFWPEGLAKSGASADALLAFFQEQQLHVYIIDQNQHIPFDPKKMHALKGMDFLNLFLYKT
jgi:FkbM family methyltransferase